MQKRFLFSALVWGSRLAFNEKPTKPNQSRNQLLILILQVECRRLHKGAVAVVSGSVEREQSQMTVEGGWGTSSGLVCSRASVLRAVWGGPVTPGSPPLFRRTICDTDKV